MYCGGEIIIKRDLQRDHTNAGIDVTALWELAEVAEQSGNFFEAFHYFTRILEITPDSSRAWLGKGVAAGAQSTLGYDRFEEMYCAFDKAIQLAADKRQELSSKIEAICPAIAIALYNTSREHLTEFVDVPGTWVEHLNRTLLIGTTLLKIESLTGEMPDLMETVIAILEQDLRGFKTVKCDYGALLPRLETRKPPREYHSVLSAVLNEAGARLRRIRPDAKIPEISQNRIDSGLISAMGVMGVVGIVLSFWVASHITGPLAVGVALGGSIIVLLGCALTWVDFNKESY